MITSKVIVLLPDRIINFITNLVVLIAVFFFLSDD